MKAWTILLSTACALGCASNLVAKDEFEALDERIVQAHNTNNKRGVEIYTLCMDMLDLCNSKKTEKSAVWQEKAKKLVALACFYEAVAAYQRNDFKQVYIWCARFSANGTANGAMGGFDLGEVAQVMTALQRSAKKALDDSGESYSNLSLQFRPVSRTDARTPLAEDKPAPKFGDETFSVIDAGKPAPDFQGTLRTGADKGIAVVTGPTEDNGKNLFVKIKTPAGREVKIIHIKGKGWSDSELPSPICYDTWEKCAEDICRREMK